jgi:hypothetical protein
MKFFLKKKIDYFLNNIEMQLNKKLRFKNLKDFFFKKKNNFIERFFKNVEKINFSEKIKNFYKKKNLEVSSNFYGNSLQVDSIYNGMIINKKQFCDEIIVENSELFPKKVLFLHINSFLKTKWNENIQTKIVSLLNLWYINNNYISSKIQLDYIIKSRKKKKIYFNTIEPKIKNIFFLFDSLEKKTKKIFLLQNFPGKSGNDFKFDENIANNLIESNIFSKVDFTTTFSEPKSNTQFANLILTLRENSSFSFKPEVNFDGNNFNGSFLIEDKNLFGKGLKFFQKTEIIPNVKKKKIKNYSFFFELSNSINPIKKIMINSQNVAHQEWINKVNLFFFENKKYEAEIKILNIKKKTNFFLNQTDINNFVNYNFNEFDSINL